MSDDQEILAAHRAFYVAFAAGDANAMEACWAAETPIHTAHPWRPSLNGRAEVLASWRMVLEQPPPIRCSDESLTRVQDVAVVTCVEHVAGGRLAATNLLVREAAGWKMFHHHAGPLAPEPEAPSPRRVH